ncbi:MAG: hypothetical protein M3Z01_02375 [Thermoproteota archaeon]|nr:hypothetical protein [Thermoproteota archaeon]
MNNTQNKISMIVIATLITGMMLSINPLAFAVAGNVHLDAAISALQSGDTNGALMYMNQADSTLTGAAKMHLDAAISALQSGDTNGALVHLQQSQKS